MGRDHGRPAGPRTTVTPVVRQWSCLSAFIAALAVVLATACAPVGPTARDELALTLGFAAADQDAQPYLVERLTSEGLFVIGPDGKVEPMLAESRSVADDGRAVTVELRPDAAFHDGSPVTSDDVKRSLDRVRRDPGSIASDPPLGDIESISSDGPHRLVISLARPSAQMLLLALASPIDKPGPDGHPLATGPFFLASAAEEETILRANAYYHGERPTIDTVRIRPYATARAGWAAMMREEVDFLFGLPAEAREFVAADSNVQIIAGTVPLAYALLFNTRHPPFDDPRVRVALSHAIDRQAILEGAFRGYGSVASGIWPTHQVYDGVELLYDYDPQEAIRRLSQLGLSPGESVREGSREELPNRLSFEVMVTLDIPRSGPTALLLQKQFRQIGVDMVIDARPLEEVFARMQEPDSWSAVIFTRNSARNLSRLDKHWHSLQQQAFTGFSGADQVLEALRSAVTEEEVRESARAFQRILFEEAPAIFLANPEEARAVSRRFVMPDEPGRDSLGTLWRWRLADPTAAH
jgi:ABC-type transport system substrate-binding protein